MAIVEKTIRLKGSRGERSVNAIFDSGSTYSCIPPGIAGEVGDAAPLPEPMDFGTADENRKMRAEEAVRLNFYIDDYRFSDEFMVIPNLSEELIIGALTLQKWRMKLDFEKEDVIIDPRVTKLRI